MIRPRCFALLALMATSLIPPAVATRAAGPLPRFDAARCPFISFPGLPLTGGQFVQVR